MTFHGQTDKMLHLAFTGLHFVEPCMSFLPWVCIEGKKGLSSKQTFSCTKAWLTLLKQTHPGKKCFVTAQQKQFLCRRQINVP